jgi:hypothetical protein
MPLALLIGPQRAAAQQWVEGGRPISPTVLVSSLVRDEKLVLLGLWRGAPGWFWKNGSAPIGPSGSTEGHVSHQYFKVGDLTFGIDFDFDSQTATIAGQTLSLRTTNVVLIDGVDRTPHVVRTLHVNPNIPTLARGASSAAPALTPERYVIPKNPDLFQFLECDTKTLPAPSVPTDAVGGWLVKFECDQVRPPVAIRGKAK